jgi:hypothetical protein
LATIVESVVSRLEAEFGPGVRNEANTIRLLVEAGFTIPFDALENEAVQILSEFDPRNATTVANLFAGVYPLFDPLSAAKAAGEVQFSYKSPLPTSPSPLFSAGEIDFIDASGKRHRTSDSILPPTALFDSNETGTASPGISDSTTTKIGQKFTTAATVEEFVQAIRFLPTTTGGTPTVRVRIETDSAGSPSGTLANSRLEKTGHVIVSATVNEVVFALGALLDAETDYWVVIDSLPASASITLDGGAGGASNQVKVYTSGAWTLTAVNTENLNIEVVRGGVAQVEAVEFGPDGNIDAGSISLVAFANSAAQTLWGNIVSLNSQENLEGFAGGRLAETVTEAKRRIRSEKSARETGSLDSIVAYLRNNNVSGVTGADGIENETDDWGTQDAVLDNSAKSGTSSETIDGTTTRIAQKFTTTEYLSISQFALDFDSAAAFGFSARVETDSTGSPSGTLVSAKFEKTGLLTSSTGRQVFAFDRGDFLSAGTYWFVLTRAAGSATLEGSNAGATDNVKVYAGSWALSANIEDARWEIFGGLPPHSFRVYVAGTASNDDIAQAIHDRKPAGAYSDGTQAGNAISASSGDTLVRRFSEPTEDPVVVKVIVTKDPNVFNGDADTIRDLVIEYIGGADSSGTAQNGVGVSQLVDYYELLARIIHGDVRTDGLKFNTLYVGRKISFPTPASLTSAQVVDLPAIQGRRYVIDTPSSDIAVTIN